jgi:endonuclease/exonuclease/phosphatase family metal-dependent hydrolase
MELRFLTFNIRYDVAHDGPNVWANRKERVLELVRDIDADIVGFQEVLPHQRWDLEKGLTGYRMVGRGRETYAGGEQCTLAFKPHIELLDCQTFWLSPNPEQAGSVGWDAMLTRICTQARLRWQGREFSVLNAHFDHHGKTAPGRSAHLILRRMASLDHPHMLMGDFNSTPDSEALDVLRSQLRDSFADQHPGDRRGTYHEYGTLALTTRIDYLMMSPHWEILECEILSQPSGPYPSDHFPVAGRYRLSL